MRSGGTNFWGESFMDGRALSPNPSANLVSVVEGNVVEYNYRVPSIVFYFSKKK